MYSRGDGIQRLGVEAQMDVVSQDSRETIEDSRYINNRDSTPNAVIFIGNFNTLWFHLSW